MLGMAAYCTADGTVLRFQVSFELLLWIFLFLFLIGNYTYAKWVLKPHS